MYFLFLTGQFRRCMLQLLCSRLTTLQKSIKDRPLARMEHPVRPIVMSQSRPDRPKKRVTFSSSSIVFIITSNEAYPLDITSECHDVHEVNVIQVRPLWHFLWISIWWHSGTVLKLCKMFLICRSHFVMCFYTHTWKYWLIVAAVMQHKLSVVRHGNDFEFFIINSVTLMSLKLQPSSVGWCRDNPPLRLHKPCAEYISRCAEIDRNRVLVQGLSKGQWTSAVCRLQSAPCRKTTCVP